MTVPLRCRLGWHPWGRWSAPELAAITSNFYNPETGQARQWTFERHVQTRTCPGCGKFAWRKR